MNGERRLHVYSWITTKDRLTVRVNIICLYLNAFHLARTE